MAQRLLELSCARFRKGLKDEDDRAIRATSLDDVRATIAQTERELASRQSLRNLDRLSPYINAIERYGTVIEGPLKFIILAVKEEVQALDRILGAYAQIGNALPRLSALQESFKDDHDFQTLFAFLYDDIIEFHKRVYRLIRRPAWSIFFGSAWARFERHFDGLISNIAKTSDLIDMQATTHHILEVKEWRQKSMENQEALERRLMSEQRLTVLEWLDTEVQTTQKDKLDWLNARSHEGTSTWIVKHLKFRSWLQRGRGNPVLWIHGKPGSGKSVLVSQIVSFIPAGAQTKDRVLYFFCDRGIPAHHIMTRIFQSYLAQCISQDLDIVPFLYEEYVAKGLSPVAKVLKKAVADVFKSMDMVRLIIDGLDEIEGTDYRLVLREVKKLTEVCHETCKLLVASQDIPSIRSVLGKASQIFLGDERQAIEKDMQIVVDATLTELDEGRDWTLGGARKAALQASILRNAEGMFLWVNLVLTLLQEPSSIRDLDRIVTTLPKNLEEMYQKLLDKIRSRCDTPRWSRVLRIFEWLLFAKGKGHIKKHDVLLGSSIHEECAILDRESIPFPTALDICKPLIEDGPGGTVAFIHSTLPCFLVESRLGPLLSPHIGHEHIAFACVSQLTQVLQLVEPEFPNEEKTEAVGLGCLGLQRYATQNWISHILDYLVEAAHAELGAEAPLMQSLLQLTSIHGSLMHPVKADIDRGVQNMVSATALEKLNAFPDTRDLIARVISFQASFSARQLVEGPDILAVDSDTTLFSLADRSYQAIVKHLLEATTSPCLTEAELISFKTHFGGTAFVCPVKDCVRGFASATELNDHKTNRHKHRIRCYEEDCVYNNVGFANTKGLQYHMKKMHKVEAPQMPIAIKRRRKVEDHELALHGLAELDLERLSTQYKKVGDDWHVIFNPALTRSLDVDIVHTLVHESKAYCVSFSMDGKLVATGCDWSAHIYDVVTGKQICVLKDNDAIGKNIFHGCVCFSPDGKHLATGGEGGMVCIWDIASCTLMNSFRHDWYVCSLEFSRDGRILVSGGHGRTVRLWDTESGKNILTLRSEGTITEVAISPDGQLVAAGSLSNSVRVWNLQGDLIAQQEDPYKHTDSVCSVAFSPNGKQLVTGSFDRTVKLWEFESCGGGKVKQARKYSKTFEGHKDVVLSVAMTTDASWVLSASMDGGVHFWETRTGDCILRVNDRNDTFRSVSASPTGTYFATASADMTVRIWKYSDVPVGLKH